MRAMNYEVWQRTYKPLTPTAAQAQESGHDEFFSFEEAKKHPPEKVWTVVESDNGKVWYLDPGFRIVNRAGFYAICEVDHAFPNRPVLYG